MRISWKRPAVVLLFAVVTGLIEVSTMRAFHLQEWVRGFCVGIVATSYACLTRRRG